MDEDINNTTTATAGNNNSENDDNNNNDVHRIGFDVDQSLEEVISELQTVFSSLNSNNNSNNNDDGDDYDGGDGGKRSEAYEGGRPNKKQLSIGRADYWLLEKENGQFLKILQQGLIDSLSLVSLDSSSSSSRNCCCFRYVEFVFEAGTKEQTPIRQDSKQERKFFKRQTLVRQKVHELAMNIQQEVFDRKEEEEEDDDVEDGGGNGGGGGNGDSERQTFVDGKTKQDILPTGDVMYKSTAIITFA